MAEINKNNVSYTVQSWSHANQDNKWVIEAYSPVKGQRQVIAEIKPDAGFPAEQLAQLIVDAVNIIKSRECLINEMQVALEICLESEDGKLNWSAEHDAEVAVRHSKARKPIRS